MKPCRAVLILALGCAAAIGWAADTNELSRGKLSFDYWCAACHTAKPVEGGRPAPGTYALQVKFNGTKPAALEQRDDLAPEFTKYVIRRGQHGMPFFRKTEISDKDMDAIAAYLAAKR
jgi:mono/diheme cytochrome c family protein